MFVYTFWEPRENIPIYLQLCMETWKKFLPNATVIVLDYKNLREFLDVRELGLNMFSGKLTLPIIADAIRVALLAKHGGIWLDVDTIILSPDAEKYFLPDEKHRTIFFGDTERCSPHIGFINTPPAAMCMTLWREYIREKIWNLNPSTSVNWDFLGNSFIDDYAKKYPDEIKIIDAALIVPERKLSSHSDAPGEAYTEYYFLQNLRKADIKADMLYLHNSWTPSFFKQLSPQELFSIDCTLSNILRDALDIKLPPPESNSACRRGSAINIERPVARKSRRVFCFQACLMVLLLITYVLQLPLLFVRRGEKFCGGLVTMKKTLAILMLAAMMFSAGCGNNTMDGAKKDAQDAAQKVEQKVDEAKTDAQAKVDDAAAKVDEAKETAAAKVDEAAQKVEEVADEIQDAVDGRTVALNGITIGSSLDDLTAMFGDATATEGDVLTFVDGLKVKLDDAKKSVKEISTTGDSFETPEGIYVGASEYSLNDNCGPADAIRQIPNGAEYEYFSGDKKSKVVYKAQNGVITEITCSVK